MRPFSPLGGEKARWGAARGRSFTARGVLGWCAGACALAVIGLAPHAALAGDPPDLIRAHSTPNVTCVPAAGGTLVRARLVVYMSVVNYEGLGGDWADHMEARVRLEPTTPGLNYSRSWGSDKTPELTINRRHRYRMTALSDTVSPRAGWRAHIKLIWHRPFPTRNISKDIYLRFNTSCVDPSGISPFPAPALPSTGYPGVASARANERPRSAQRGSISAVARAALGVRNRDR